ncbi:MAG TPA: CBS domain-containing protein [Vicinamibacteria bacterium]|nr:CBS domain-containing protein [Vicinamibacteria bacterium]
MENRCPECGKALPRGVPAWTRQLTVAQVMTRDPLTLGPEDSLATAVQVMRKHRIRRLPIVMGGALVGLLAEGDLKRAEPSTLSASQEEFEAVMEGTQLSRIMIREPLTVTEETPLLEAVKTLQTTKFGALPVVADGRLVGIVTDNDLLRALRELLEHGG